MREYMIDALIINKEWLCLQIDHNIWIVQEKNGTSISLAYIKRIEHFVGAMQEGCDPFNLKYELSFTYDESADSFLFNELYSKFLGQSVGPSEIDIFLKKLYSKEILRERYLDFFLFNPGLFDRIGSNYTFFDALKSWMNGSKDDLISSLENYDLNDLLENGW
jgi:hypothetical protein